jgi:hypothetical protein
MSFPNINLCTYHNASDWTYGYFQANSWDHLTAGWISINLSCSAPSYLCLDTYHEFKTLLCHEIGHSFGVAHVADTWASATCMADGAITPSVSSSPHNRDIQQLDTYIYGYWDGDSRHDPSSPNQPCHWGPCGASIAASRRSERPPAIRLVAGPIGLLAASFDTSSLPVALHLEDGHTDDHANHSHGHGHEGLVP